MQRTASWLFASVCTLLGALGCGGQSVTHRGVSDAGGTGASGGVGATAGTGTASDSGGSATNGGFSPTAGDAGKGGSAGTSSAPAPDWVLTYEPDASVAYMIDPAHSGAQLSVAIDPPLALLWSRQLDGAVSYPLVVGQSVFVTANGADGPVTTVFALAAATGETVWQVTPWSSIAEPTSAELAYDRGLVFAADATGHVAAFDAATGTAVWSVALDTRGFGSFPLAAGGAVYLVRPSEDGTYLYALNEADGSVVYRVPSQPGDPTLGGRLIYATSGCFETTALAIETGEEAWHYRGACSGGAGGRTGYWLGYLFALDAQPQVGVLDTVSGGLYRTLDLPEVFWPMTLGTEPLVAEVPPDRSPPGIVRYDTMLDQAAVLPLDEGLRLPLLETPRYLYAVFEQNPGEPVSLAALEPETGDVIWRTTASDEFGDDPTFTPHQGDPHEGIAAGNERVVVALNRSVAAYASLRIK